MRADLAMMACGAALALGAGAEPIDATTCELMKEPARFDGKTVVVRSRILIAFEQFELDPGECGPTRITDVWLEYGRGPKHQPTIWCCGDTRPHDPLRVKEDKNFRVFDRDLTAHSPEFEVTATLSGRFDTRAVTSPGSVDRCPGNGEGFGHMGFACSRLVIEYVTDVVTKPVGKR